MLRESGSLMQLSLARKAARPPGYHVPGPPDVRCSHGRGGRRITGGRLTAARTLYGPRYDPAQPGPVAADALNPLSPRASRPEDRPSGDGGGMPGSAAGR